MRLKRIFTYTVVLFLLLLSTLVFFSPSWLSKLPEVEVFKGELQFNGELAYQKLKELVNNYPGRTFGSLTDKDSSIWIENEFKKLGLSTSIETFDNAVGNAKIPLKGYNVVGISRGETEETIVIGAHRDVAGNYQGAEDNGSGTATMLELARVLVGSEHYYTYTFVSFDGEELGRLGSIRYAGLHSGSKVKLAYILDMTGYKDARTVGFYPFVTRNGAAPLWTLALGDSILAGSNKQLEYAYTPFFKPSNSVQMFLQIVNQRLFGHINTDSSAFVENGIPAVGIMAAGDTGNPSLGWYSSRIIHKPDDTLDQTSAVTLQMAGSFSEQYIKSFELYGKYSWKLSSRFYYVTGNLYMPPEVFLGFFTIVFILIGSLTVMAFVQNKVKFSAFLRFLRSEKSWIISAALLALVVTWIFQLIRQDSFNLIPGKLKFLLIATLFGAGCLTLFYLRYKSLNGDINNYISKLNCQTGLINLIYFLVSGALILVINPFQAFCIMLFPFFMTGAASFTTRKGWFFRIIVFILWSIAEIGVIGYTYKFYILQSNSLNTAAAIFLYMILWLYTLLYVACTPLPAKDLRDSKECLTNPIGG